MTVLSAWHFDGAERCALWVQGKEYGFAFLYCGMFVWLHRLCVVDSKGVELDEMR